MLNAILTDSLKFIKACAATGMHVLCDSIALRYNPIKTQLYFYLTANINYLLNIAVIVVQLNTYVITISFLL